MTYADDPPIRAFLKRVEELSSGASPDVTAIGRALGELAANEAYFARFVDQMTPDDMGVIGFHMPDRGPRLFLMHRPRGVMSYVHSHGTWVAIASVKGVETHRTYQVDGTEPPDKANIAMAEEVQLRPGDAATLVPPGDIHAHGHSGGDEEVPYALIMVGDDQLQFARREYDVEAGTYRDLPPGDFGRLNMP